MSCCIYLRIHQIIRNYEFVIRNSKNGSEASPFKASMFERGLNPGSNINYELRITNYEFLSPPQPD